MDRPLSRDEREAIEVRHPLWTGLDGRFCTEHEDCDARTLLDAFDERLAALVAAEAVLSSLRECGVAHAIGCPKDGVCWCGLVDAVDAADTLLAAVRTGGAEEPRRCPYCKKPGAVIGLHSCVSTEGDEV